MKYTVPLWGVVLLALLACVSILLAAASAVFIVRAKAEIVQTQVLADRADSLLNDWVKRGCAPRTQTLP